jgi:rhodanese-related sulfurtransferase
MVAQMQPLELKARLDAGDAPVLLDVRESWELAIARLPAAVHIPMGEIPRRLKELDAQREVVVLCRSGGRSMQVARYLETQGFGRVANLDGGILAWGRDVDPSLPEY